ncbi:MAG TPA: TylF/MycF/NovP-related O-methyltransferase [Solirubrobacteraceae bacterium]|nr:TylF/MycF/NovP-related O-methyltransferase [Solirubrobacteraceae bacterium]
MGHYTTKALETIPLHLRVRVKEALARAAGLPWDELARLDVERVGRPDLDASALAILERVERYTLTPPDRVAALCGAIDYLVDREIPGDVVECGVWKGGSLMACALRLRDRGATDRRLLGFDTFAGMTDPTEEDVDFRGIQQQPEDKGSQMRVDAGLEDVTENLRSTGYPMERVRLVKGDVRETIPAQAPEQIALLRLDTDWYESTRHELEHLFPRLAVGGVLLIDDYGHYRGSKKATDEYLRDKRIFLQRVDYAARLGVKQSG